MTERVEREDSDDTLVADPSLAMDEMMSRSLPLSRVIATDTERTMTMAGDELIEDPPMCATRSITILAPPERVFPWLVQMGFGRAGWYSHDWIDNLGRRSADTILDEFQHLEPGDVVPGGPIDFIATTIEPEQAFGIIFGSRWIRFSLAFELHPLGGTTTRLVSRARAAIDLPLADLIARYLLGFGDGIMVRKQLRGIKRRAEAAMR